MAPTTTLAPPSSVTRTAGQPALGYPTDKARHASPARAPHEIGDQETAAVVGAAARGDEAAWRDLFVRYNGLVWWVVRGYRLNEDQAADIVQLTWTRLVEHIDGIRDPERLGGWLAQTARRLCTATLRTAAREQRLQEDLCEAVAAEDPELFALRRDQRTVLRRALDRLSPRDRALLTHLFLAPVSYAQISRLLDMPPGSIGPTRARVLHRLRAELADLDLTDAALD